MRQTAMQGWRLTVREGGDGSSAYLFSAGCHAEACATSCTWSKPPNVETLAPGSRPPHLGLAVLLLFAAAAAFAAGPIDSVLLELSTSLESGNAARFLDQVDKQRCPQYAALESNVVALAAQYEVGSSIGIIEQTEKNGIYDLKLDWMLEVRPAGGDSPAERRRQEVHCRIERVGRRWKVTVLEPVSFFSAIAKR